MKRKRVSIKKALFGSMAFIMAATLVFPVSTVFADEVETRAAAGENGTQDSTAQETNLQLANHTAGTSVSNSDVVPSSCSVSQGAKDVASGTETETASEVASQEASSAETEVVPDAGTDKVPEE